MVSVQAMIQHGLNLVKVVWKHSSIINYVNLKTCDFNLIWYLKLMLITEVVWVMFVSPAIVCLLVCCYSTLLSLAIGNVIDHPANILIWVKVLCIQMCSV